MRGYVMVYDCKMLYDIVLAVSGRNTCYQVRNLAKYKFLTTRRYLEFALDCGLLTAEKGDNRTKKLYSRTEKGNAFLNSLKKIYEVRKWRRKNLKKDKKSQKRVLRKSKSRK